MSRLCVVSHLDCALHYGGTLTHEHTVVGFFFFFFFFFFSPTTTKTEESSFDSGVTFLHFCRGIKSRMPVRGRDGSYRR